ncbi:MAG TPA: hypothetical protein VF892_18240, partial [Pseudonocardiaceae bacterium]
MNHARGRLFLAALATIGLISGLVSAGPAAAATKYDWPQFGFDESKSGNDTAETAINLANVTGLKKLFSVKIT